MGVQLARRVDPVPAWLVVALVVAVVTVGLVLTSVSAALFGDGAAYLLGIVGSGQSVGIPGRTFISTLRDAPVIVALGFGETNLRVLSVVQSAAYILLPVAAWVAALLVSARDRARFVIVAVLCGLCVGLLGFFSVSELFPALALVAFAAASLADPKPWTPWQSVAVAASSTVLAAAHPAVAVCAALLVLHGAARAWARLGTWDMSASIWVAVAGLATIAWPLSTLVAERKIYTADFAYAVVGLVPRSAFLLTGAAVVAVAWLMVGGLRSRWTVSFAAMTVVIASVGAAMAGVVLVSGPAVGYRSRVWCLIAVVLGQAALLGIWWARRASRERRAIGISDGSLSVLALFVPLVLSLQLMHAVTWSRGIEELRHVLAAERGLVSPAESMTPEGQRILWGWTNPALSVVVRYGTTGGVMLDQAEASGTTGRYAPFEPSRMQSSLPPEFTWR